MKIYNTLTRKKDEFIPIEEGKVRIYACGPTVYNFIHIGNARPICVFDTLRRYLEYRGYEVKFVQNFTDIDDKIIKRANEEGSTQKGISEKYIEEYKKDATGLGVRPATIHPKATETIDEIINVIKTLEEKGFAYASNGDVYFRVRKFKEYGKLSHRDINDLMEGARVDVSEQKEDPLDFALWKAAKPGEPYWESPWGQGRPGWHIECTAMIRKHLGETIDIHCGGSDLIFPHHENEIAQGECCSSKEYAHYWMHNGFINVDNQKMSKSLGNFFTTREVAEKFGYEPIRYLMLSVQYRNPINYSYDAIEQCKSALERLYTCRDNLDFALGHANNGVLETKITDDYKQNFINAMEDDLNTADALGVLFEFVKYINSVLNTSSKETLEYIAKVFDELVNVLGLLYNRKKDSLDSEIEKLIEERQQARKNKDFKRADEIRDSLKSQGIILEDTPQGVKWHKE